MPETWVKKVGERHLTISKQLDALRKKYPDAPPDKGKGKIDLLAKLGLLREPAQQFDTGANPFRRGALLEGVSLPLSRQTREGTDAEAATQERASWSGATPLERFAHFNIEKPLVNMANKAGRADLATNVKQLGYFGQSLVNPQATELGQTATNVIGVGLLAYGAYQTLDAAYSGLTNYATRLAFQKMAASRGGKLTPQEVRVAQDWASQFTRNSILKADAKTLFKRTQKGYEPTDAAVKVADDTATKAIAEWKPTLAPKFTPGGSAVPGQTRPLSDIMAGVVNQRTPVTPESVAAKIIAGQKLTVSDTNLMAKEAEKVQSLVDAAKSGGQMAASTSVQTGLPGIGKAEAQSELFGEVSGKESRKAPLIEVPQQAKPLEGQIGLPEPDALKQEVTSLQNQLKDLQDFVAMGRNRPKQWTIPSLKLAIADINAQLEIADTLKYVQENNLGKEDLIRYLQADVSAIETELGNRSMPYNGGEKNHFPNVTTKELEAQRKRYIQFIDGLQPTETGEGVTPSPTPVPVTAEQVAKTEPTPAVTATEQAQKVDAGEGGVIPPIEPPVSGGSAGGGQLPEDFAANIRLSKYPEEVRQFIKEWADANPEAIASARRGVRSDAEVLADAKELADDIGGDFARMQSRWKAGDAWNAEEILALRGTLRAKTEAIMAAQKVALQSNSTENLLKLKVALDEQAAVQEAVSGVTAEAGRALRQFRQEVFGASTDAEKLERLLKEVGGRDKIEDLAKLLGEIDINNPVAVNAFIRSLNKPGFWDYITEIYYNSILSGPKTHIVNSLSNTFNAIVSPVERGAAALIDAPLSRWQGREQARFLGEVPADVFGAISGITDGFKVFGQTYKTGISPQQASKFEMQRTKAFTGIPGRVINFPSTSLEAADAFMKTINYRAAFNATAFRMVKKSGKKGSDFIEALAELKANPTRELLAEADKITEARLYRAPAGKTTQTIMNLRDALAIGGFKPLRYIIPFVRTPANLLKYGIERSPGGWMNPKLWENVAKKNPEAADQIGRAVLGTLAAVAIMWYVLEEKITGAAPTNSAERDRFYRDGKQPFSVKVGNNWISYQRLEPFNQTFAQVAAVYEATKNKERDAMGKATDAMSTIAQNMVSQTYLSGLSSVIDALSQPERYASSILTRFGTALIIPASSLTRTAAQIADKTVRDAQNLGDEFKVGIPGLSKQVPSKLTTFGEDVIRTTPAWSPINISPSKETPLTQELDRLKINIGFTGSTIAGIPLTLDEQRAYQIQAGQLTEEMLTALMSNPAYPSASDTEKEKAINLMVDKARNQARTTILAGIPIAERVNRVKNKTITPLAPVQAAPQTLKDRLKPRAVPSGAR